MSYRPYSIRTPDFEPTSGGIRVMYGLYGWLLSKGQVVYLNARINDHDFVGVYPDIYRGNDMGATKVVRYLLNTPGVMGLLNPTTGLYEAGDSEFPPEEDVYFFSKVFDNIGVDDDHIMFLPILNMHLFKDQKRNRTKRAVFFGKGEGERNKHPEDCETFDRKFAQDQKALADFLNECEVVYIYDQVTAMSEIARLCGCRVVYFPENITLEQYEKYEPGMNGISWGKDTGEKLDIMEFKSHYNALRSTFEDKLDKFIRRTQ